jgi:hypothetical protein
MARKRDGKDARKSGKASEAGSEPMPKSVKRHLRRLEAMLAAARKKEAARVRKLAKSHIRRQRIESAIDEIRLATAPIARPPVAAAAKAAAKAEPAATEAAPAADGPAAKPRRPRTSKPAGA